MTIAVSLNIERIAEEAERQRRYIVPAGKLTQQILRELCKAGILQEPFRECFARSDYLSALPARGKTYHLIRTVALQHPTWTFCSFSAALIYGLQMPVALLNTVHVGATKHQNRRITAPFISAHLIGPYPTRVYDGMVVTSIVPTLFDCLRNTSFRRGLAIIDSALHLGIVSRAELQRYIDEHGKGKHGTARARQTLRYADPRSANGGESTVRAIIIELGFQVPELQVEIADPLNPATTKTVDYYWELADGRIVILELDGFQKYHATSSGRELSLKETQRVLANERHRESHINLTGATVLRLSYEEATNEAFLARALEVAGIPRAHRQLVS